MRVSNNSNGANVNAKAQNISQTNSTAFSAYGKGASEAVKLEFSEKATAIAVAAVAVDASPDTRWDLINRIKPKVDSGQYSVPSSKIAESILSRHPAYAG